MAISFDIWRMFTGFAETATINGQSNVDVIALSSENEPEFAEDGYNQNIDFELRCKISDLTDGVPNAGKLIIFRGTIYRIVNAKIDAKNITVKFELGEQYRK